MSTSPPNIVSYAASTPTVKVIQHAPKPLFAQHAYPPNTLNHKPPARRSAQPTVTQVTHQPPTFAPPTANLYARKELNSTISPIQPRLITSSPTHPKTSNPYTVPSSKLPIKSTRPPNAPSHSKKPSRKVFLALNLNHNPDLNHTPLLSLTPPIRAL